MQTYLPGGGLSDAFPLTLSQVWDSGWEEAPYNSQGWGTQHLGVGNDLTLATGKVTLTVSLRGLSGIQLG